jgi:membrane protease YdiL (CAAX protease family)
MLERIWSRIGWIFVGVDGLRAGWRFLLFAFGIVLGTWFVEEPSARFLAQLHGSEIARLGLLWLGANILVGIGEEYTFRGYALRSLWRGGGFWPAALITSALFAGDHLEKPGENAMDIGMIFFGGLILCLSVRQTGSLWWAVGWHAAFDFGQLFLIGTRNGGYMPLGHLFEVTFPGPAWLNGGELGTEASIFMVQAAIATFIYVIWFLRGRLAR